MKHQPWMRMFVRWVRMYTSMYEVNGDVCMYDKRQNSESSQMYV